MKPYDTEQDKKEQVREMFDRIAPAYDRLNHTLSFQIDKLWRRHVVRIVRRMQPRRILDVATGTGDLALAMARRMRGVQVLGVDLSENMLAEARRKATACEVFIVASGTGIIGRQKSRRTVAIVHFAQISGACEDVVAGIVWVTAEAITDTQLRPGIRHDLHQAHRARRRYCAHIAGAFDAANGAYPVLGDAETLRSFGNETGMRIGD